MSAATQPLLPKWASWTWQQKYLPKDIHQSDEAFQGALSELQNYLWKSRNYVTAVVLGLGLLIRDCWRAQELEQPEDGEPTTAPKFLYSLLLGICQVEKVFKVVTDICSRLDQSKDGEMGDEAARQRKEEEEARTHRDEVEKKRQEEEEKQHKKRQRWEEEQWRQEEERRQDEERQRQVEEERRRQEERKRQEEEEETQRQEDAEQRWKDEEEKQVQNIAPKASKSSKTHEVTKGK